MLTIPCRPPSTTTGACRTRVEREGRSLQDDTLQVFHTTDGKATEVWTYPRDQYASDEFWS